MKEKIEGKKLICIMMMIFDINFVITKYVPYSLYDVFAGVEYNGYILFYASTIMYFAVFFFWEFGNTEKYVKGYGVLELCRHMKRTKIVNKIILRITRNVLLLLLLGIFIFETQSYIINGKCLREYDIKLIKYILIVVMVIVSLEIWQSIFEIIAGSKIAILMILGIVTAHLGLGDVMKNRGIKDINQIFSYSNLAVYKRYCFNTLNYKYLLVFMLVVILLQTIMLNVLFKRKNIY